MAFVLGKYVRGAESLVVCRVSPNQRVAPPPNDMLCIVSEKKNEKLVRQLCSDLRGIQQRNKCTDSVCTDVVLTLSKYLSVTPANFRKYDKIMQKEAGIRFLALNGCPKCNQFVFLPEDPRRVCPICGGPRYDSVGKPLEVIIYMFCLLFDTLFLLLTIYLFDFDSVCCIFR